MLSTTDDLRISELKELSTPQEVMREIPRTLTATRIVMASRNAIHAILNGTDDRLLVVVGPCSIHDPAAAVDYAEPPRRPAREARRPPRDRDARLFREAAHDGRLEGTDQRSRPRRQLQHQHGPASRPQRAVGGEQSRPAGRRRIPRHDDAAIHRRPGGVGGDRRAHHREPDPSRARFRTVLPGRLQERHRRQCPDRRRRGEVGVASAPFHGGDQGRPLGDRGNHRQRGLPHHPARRPHSRTTTAPASMPRRPNLRAPASHRGS